MYNSRTNLAFALGYILAASYALLCGAVQVARVLPSPVGDASQMFRHNDYVDSKVRQVAVNFLNHQDYHQRNVVFPSSASIFQSFVSNLSTATALFSDAGIQLQPTSTISVFAPLQISRKASTDASVSSNTASAIKQPALKYSVNNLGSTAYSTGQASTSLKVPSSPQTTSALPASTISKASAGNATEASVTAGTHNPFIATGIAKFDLSGPSSPVSLASSVTNTTSIGSTGPKFTASTYKVSAATGIGNATLSAVALSNLSRHALADSLYLTASLSPSALTDNSWENDTDNACSARLYTLGGVATNPSGISACYNIRSLNNFTGAFHADLRLYRIAAATGDWTQMQSNGVSVGMAYPDATVTLSNIVRKRGLVEFQGPIMLAIGSQLHTRTSDVAPQLLETLSFMGKIHNGSVPELYVE